MRIKVGDRVYDKVSQRYGIVKKFVGEDFVGMFYVKADRSEESEWRFPEDIELADSPEKDSRDSNSMKIIYCKDCELWNTWDKQGELCSCAHFTLDNSNAVYTKPEDFCSYAEKTIKLSSNRGDSMTRNELLGALCFPEYNFLRENEHLGKHMMFVTVGGSHAYGTNVEGSDLDIRGVALNSREDLLGLGEFEHYVDTQTDTTIYSFNKAVKLMCSGNPNILEQLGNADELVISYNPMTKLLIDNKNLFLSKRVIYSFGGFAGKLIQKADTLDKDLIYHNSKKMHKTVMNAVRVYLMLFDILEKGEIKTYRDNDHNFLTQLRNGEYDYKEIRQQLIPAYESRLSVDKSETYLPDNVDWKRVNELVMTVNEESLRI